MTATELLSQYGYLAVFAGSVIEGETILILAGFAAHQGYLSFPLVVATGFLGGALGDMTFFFLGRRYGQALFERYPRLASHVEQMNRLILRFRSMVIVMVRFMYGLRVAGPVIIGSSGVGVWRFVVFNLLGAVIWAVLIGGVGYVFGQTLDWLFEDIRHYEKMVGAGVLAVGATLLLRRWWQRYRAAARRV